MTTPNRQRSSTAAPGFSLLELIISVALVLVLMLAITKIFSITSTTIGASQGIGAAVRDARAAQAVFARDIGAMASDSPFVWIRSDQPQPAFRNRLDELSDHDYQSTSGTAAATTPQTNAKLTLDVNDDGVDGDTTVQGESFLTQRLVVNTRNHRQDRFSFCARDRFYRQTGNTVQNELVSSISSAEAWITYGHLVLPHKNGVFKLNGDTATALKTNPGDGTAETNPQNFYADQWILGRVAMLMVLPTNAPSGTPANELINDANGVSQEFIKRSASWTAPANFSMSPLSDGSTANYPTASGETIQSARYDLIGTDIYNATARINKYISGPAVTGWWANMLSSRFEVNPFVIKPINASTAAAQAPVFLSGCSQFIVEFAGDFVEQDPTTGAVTALESDGQIDFAVVGGIRKVRWYGFPRDSNNDGTITAAGGDVVPVSDFALAPGTLYTSGTNPYSAFEHFTNSTATSRTSYPPLSPSFGDYFAAFGPDTINNPAIPRPRMYRITVTIDRPEMAGRTPDGQTFEYVFNAP